jgi:hypothetical protein
MSVREDVRFNQKFDCIEGFEDIGSQGRICNIANRAVRFTVVVCIGSGSSQWLTTSVVEALRLRYCTILE